MKYFAAILLIGGIGGICNAQSLPQEESIICIITGPNTATCLYDPALEPEMEVIPKDGNNVNPKIKKDGNAFMPEHKKNENLKKNNSDKSKTSISKENFIEI